MIEFETFGDLISHFFQEEFCGESILNEPYKIFRQYQTRKHQDKDEFVIFYADRQLVNNEIHIDVKEVWFLEDKTNPGLSKRTERPQWFIDLKGQQ